MPRLSAAFAAAALIVAGLAAPSLAQNEDDLRLCERPGNPRADRIAACDRVIGGGGLDADDLADIHETRGELLIDAGDYETALADFDAMLALDPGSRDANRLRGLALLHLGRAEEALAELDIAVGINPRFGFNLYVRGLAHAVLGDIDEALTDFADAIGADPNSRLPTVQAGRVLIDAGRLDEARAAFEDVMSREPFEPRAYVGLAMLADLAGDSEEAIRNYAIAELLDPDLAAPAMRLAELVPPTEVESPGALAFAPPAEGLSIRTITLHRDVEPEPVDATLEIGDRIFWRDAPSTTAPPFELNLHRWDIGATDDERTEAAVTRIVNNSATATEVEYTNLLFAHYSPDEEGEGREIRYSGLEAIWSLSPGESASGLGRVYFRCPENPGPAARAAGCEINIPDVRGGTIEWTATFAGWEYVLVPAGLRLAARIEFDVTFAIGINEITTTERQSTIWYDPAINWWIKRRQIEEGVIEIVEATAIDLP
jgi:tetratricopeptide (TPR) repeat protein